MNHLGYSVIETDLIRGCVKSWGERKHSVYMNVPGANSWGWLGSFYLKKDAEDALAIYRVMNGRDPYTGEVVK